MSADSSTPVIVGVGQSVDRIESPAYRRWSAADLAAEAARSALADAGLSADALRRIDAIVTTRTFEDMSAGPAPFGRSDNFPRSIAARLESHPRRAFWSKAGGNTPQDLVNEFCGRIAKGEFDLVLLCGAEAISTVRNAIRGGDRLDFAETPGGEVEDRGSGVEEYRDPLAQRHGIVNAPIGYGLAENARRARLRMSRVDYAEGMGRLFEPFARIAHDNPHSAWDVPTFPAEALVTVSPSNRWVADPYPLRLVSRDQVNQGAAVLIASGRVADDLSIPPGKRVYLHGHAQAKEKPLLARPDLGASPAARAVAATALQRAGLAAGDIAAFDFYSCFPIAVSNVAIDALGLAEDDPRHLTATGGLPFFGGPGNNYSMHAIAEMVERVRRCPGQAGMVGANGGYLSKYSAGIYSTTPRAWRDWRNDALQAELDAVPSVEPVEGFSGPGTVETYSIAYHKGEARYAVIVGRARDGVRFIARSRDGDHETVAGSQRTDPIGRGVMVETGPGNIGVFTFEPSGQ